MLLGSTRVKASRKTLVRLTPEVTIDGTNEETGKADEDSINQENNAYVTFTQPETNSNLNNRHFIFCIGTFN